MKVTKVGTRGIVFSFYDPYLVNIYVINGDKHIFICDTGLGSDFIDQIFVYLTDQKIDSKPMIVFNSHTDYDHIWGNHMFPESMILAQERSINVLEKEGVEALEKYSSHKRGEVDLTFPNQLFKDNYVFTHEGIEFYHTPGHTLESSSCYDSKDKTLFVGDNIESPYPYVNFLNLEDYKATLSEYLTRDVEIVVSGHDEVMFHTDLIKSNLEYLNQLTDGVVDRSQFSKKQRGIHFLNITRIGEMMKNEGNSKGSRKFYTEAVEILREIEQTEEIKMKIENLEKIISELT
ncbi:MBL fold metallo-hydrolase [Candidatus Heimdallarchaeota archaeon]|nr:MAG: MBL fold metallo-hydrolase [Candidatus Heimdallarchaeota archaeon]